MEHVTWSDRPALRRPILVAAFEGWNDAGDAASTAARYLADQLRARPFAGLDAEPFYDFATNRPTVELDSMGRRSIAWPRNELRSAELPDSDRDLIIMSGIEPRLKWQTYCAEITELATEMEVSMVVTLGALLADVRHDQDVQIIGSSYDPALAERMDLRRSNYEGPTGIVGVLQQAFGDLGVDALSLWAPVPSYVPGAPSPKAALALVVRLEQVIGVSLSHEDLEAASRAYEQQVSRLVETDEDVAEYVAQLEAVTEPEESDTDALLAEVERFLRDQGEDPS